MEKGEVLDVKVIPLVCTPSIIMYASAFKGRLSVAAYWNEAFFSVKKTREFLDRIMDVLLVEMGVDC